MSPEIHGVRASYQRGCRCLPCRAANAEYSRQYVPEGWTDARAPRRHLRSLRRHGIGLRQCARLSGLSVAHLQRIRNGQQRTVTLATAQLVLAITPTPAKGSCVSSYRTRSYLRRLGKEGYPKARIAQLLGLRTPRLWFPKSRQVRQSSALRMASLWDMLTAES